MLHFSKDPRSRCGNDVALIYTIVFVQAFLVVGLWPMPARAQAPNIETTGFEASDWDAFSPTDTNFFCGSPWWTTCHATPIATNCSGNPAAEVNCCATDPNPLNGWFTSADSQHCREPHIDIVHPASGFQHLRFQRDPAGGNPTGCVGLGNACRVSAFTPDMGAQVVGPTTVSFNIAGTASGENLEYSTIGTDGGTGTHIKFDAAGVLYIYDTGNAAFSNAGPWQNDGNYHNVRIEKNPCAETINYFYDGALVYSTALDETATVESAIFDTDNGPGWFDIDNYSVQRGSQCSTCMTNADCDDHDTCTQDQCVGSVCVHTGQACKEPPTGNEPGAPCTGCKGCTKGRSSELLGSVYIFSGEFHASAADLQIPSRGLDLVWGRKYRSKIGPNTPMGNGWDFSYNIYLEHDGPNLIVHNGETRADQYFPQPNGTWTRLEFFREIRQNADNTYSLVFPDTGDWNFFALDGSPHAGKIASILDRNGNTITFTYNANGQLATVNTLAAVVPPAPLPDPSGFDKVRYISFIVPPDESNPSGVTALQVKLVSLMHPNPPNLPQFPPPNFTTSEGSVLYVGNPSDCQETELPPTSFKCASLQCAPVYIDWVAALNGATLHVTGQAVVPSSTYEVHQLPASCQGSEATCKLISDPLTLKTQRWGDVAEAFQAPSPAPLTQPNITDVSACVDKFKAVPTAIIVARSDVNPAVPNHRVDIADVANIVDAFKNLAYPFPGPTSCANLLGSAASVPPPALRNPSTGRNLIISYNTNGYIDSVTDFAGRTVTYTYYDGVEPEGNLGDLKSVTTPAVVNTSDFPIPSGNEYPLGKTTIYTYSTGAADGRLNHNLLTITDPKGQTYLVNEYDSTTNPSDLNFDRIKRQTLGNSGDITDLVYVPQTPTLTNNFATMKVIENDRVGNVKEAFYDAGNREVIRREYTGRADPDQPTTETLNRPTGKLRATDPDYFETRHEYNADSLCMRMVYPNGNEATFSYDSSNTSRRAQGNVLSQCQLPGSLGGDQASICELFEYDGGFGSCCDTNFVTKHTDGRGNVTMHTYDAHGNRLHTQHRLPSIVEDREYNNFGQMTAHILPDNGGGHRRRDEFTYYSSGPQIGYLHEEKVDATGFDLTTTYEYDIVGNEIRVIDPRGHDSLSIYNQLNQVVRTTSREVTSGSGVRYETDMYYDANDNVARVDVQNKNENGALQSNDHFTTITEYDILNYRTKTCAESGSFNVPQGQFTCTGLPASEFITSETIYDANRNPIRNRAGEAVENRQPNNITDTSYDERDLVFRTTQGGNDPGKSTTQFDYDANGNRTTTRQGIEDTPRVTITVFDGHDRVISSTDPMGNVTTTHYDSDGNRVSTRTDGASTNDVPGSAGNVRLAEMTYQYDAMDRVIRTDASFFDTQTQAAIGDGLSTTTTEYTGSSQVKRVVDDNSHQTVTTYDTANRQSKVTDHKGNSVTSTYDANGNVISRTELEKSELGNPDQTFVTTFVHDNLDRVTTTTDNVGSTMQYFYDSRGNRTRTVDALNHETRIDHDGLSRTVRTIRDMDGDGADGDGADIITGQTWDDDSRRTGQTDDNANTTAPQFDALDRVVATDMADCTQPTKTYDVHHNLVSETDANGTVVNYSYDLLNRVTSKSIVPGPGVSNDTTFENYQYDGRSRLISAQDNDSLVTRKYDSMSNIIQEIQQIAANPPRTVASTYDGVGNELICTYPGGRVIATTYDELDRKKSINDTTTGFPQLIATYSYIGPGRVERRDFGNGTRTAYTYDGIPPNPSNDFGVRQIVRTKQTKSDATDFDNRTFHWDRMGNKTQRFDVRAGGLELILDYTYDAIDRLIHTVATDRTPAVVRDTQYVFDGVGNRLQVIGSPDSGLYSMNAAVCEPADLEMNQYTSTSFDQRQYDKNGNLVRIDFGLPTQRDIQYNYAGIIVGHEDSNGISSYRYDALGRRIEKVVDPVGSPPPVTTRFCLHGWQEIEEQDSAGATVATYMFGNSIDEVLTRRRVIGTCSNNPTLHCSVDPDCGAGNTCIHNLGLDYYHTDDLFNVMAVTDVSGSVVERYDYQDYGDPAFFAANGAPILQSQISNPVLYAGRRYDPETALYYYRTRYLDPTAGRFMSRDTIGIWGDKTNTGNAYTYVGNDPATRVDPLGFGALCTAYSLIPCNGTWFYTGYNDKEGHAICACAPGWGLPLPPLPHPHLDPPTSWGGGPIEWGEACLFCILWNADGTCFHWWPEGCESGSLERVGGGGNGGFSAAAASSTTIKTTKSNTFRMSGVGSGGSGPLLAAGGTTIKTTKSNTFKMSGGGSAGGSGGRGGGKGGPNPVVQSCNWGCESVYLDHYLCCDNDPTGDCCMVFWNYYKAAWDIDGDCFPEKYRTVW